MHFSLSCVMQSMKKKEITEMHKLWFLIQIQIRAAVFIILSEVMKIIHLFLVPGHESVVLDHVLSFI